MASWYGVGSIITDPSVFGQFGFAPRGAGLRSFAAKFSRTVEQTVKNQMSPSFLCFSLCHTDIGAFEVQ